MRIASHFESLSHCNAVVLRHYVYLRELLYIHFVSIDTEVSVLTVRHWVYAMHTVETELKVT